MGYTRSHGGHDFHVLSVLITAWWVTCVCVCGTPLSSLTTVDQQDATDSSHQPEIMWVENPMPVTIYNRSVNSVVEFDCNVKSVPGRERHAYKLHPKITWMKGDKPIEIRNKRISKSGYLLKIADLIPQDSGNYTCIVRAGAQELQWKFFLHVTYKPGSIPVFVRQPKNQTVAEGSRATFRCENPMPGVEMIWVKLHNINGSWGKGPVVKGDPHLTILRDWSLDHGPLVIPDVRQEDAGWYMCGLRNSLGPAHEAAYLNVMTPAPSKQIDSQSVTDTNTVILVIVICAVLVIMTIISVVPIIWYKKRSMDRRRFSVYHKNYVPQTEPLMKPGISSQSSTSSYPSVPPQSPRQSITADEAFEFPRNRLIIQETIGQGAFGVVNKAVAFGLTGCPEDRTVVAVKSLKEYTTPTEQLEFEKELEVMKSVKRMGCHINIVNFLGCCTVSGPTLVIVEYCEKGNLRDYLLSFRNQHEKLVRWRDAADMEGMNEEEAENMKNMLSEKILLSFSHQIARGMAFLASNKCIHRDLAARNVLVTENNILKIADFGMARSGDYYKKKSGGQIPVKWMPPEALFDSNYTVKSDVWSFGIVLWEIFSLGGMPYPTIPHQNLYNKLMEGYRLEKPPLSPDSLYDTMRQCWNHFPDDRPDFQTLILILERHLVRVSNGGYLEVLPDDTVTDNLETVVSE